MADQQGNKSLGDLLGLTYEAAQELSTKLLASNKPEDQEMGKLISELDPSFFDLTNGQQQLKNLVDYFSHLGLDEGHILNVINIIIQTTAEQVQTDVVAKMPEDLQRKWMVLSEHGPNVFQQMVLINHVCEKLLFKDFETLFDEKLQEVTGDFTKALEFDMELDTNVAKLSEQQVSEITSLFEEGKYEEAMSLIYKSRSTDEHQ